MNSAADSSSLAALAIRVRRDNPNHHLWNNNGTWWFHGTVHLSDFTKQRVRVSLQTPCVMRARKRRDGLLKGGAGRLVRTGC